MSATDTMTAAAWAEQADKWRGQTFDLVERAAKHVRDVIAMKNQVAILLGTIDLPHEWDGTKLRIRTGPDSWGPYVNLAGPSGDSDAALVPFTPGSGISATNVQAALIEAYVESARAFHTHSSADITDLAAVIAAALDAFKGGALPSNLDTIVEITTALVAAQTAITVLSAGKQDALGYTPQNAASKGIANGYAGLGSDGRVPTAQLPDAVLGALKYQGVWNASTNSPAIPAAASGNLGWYRIVTTAGTTTIDTINDWKIGDWIVSDGTTWSKVDNTDAVTSVATLTGVITAVALKAALAIAIADVSGLQAALDAKHATSAIASVAEFCTGTDNDKRPTSKTIADACAPSSIAYGSTVTLDLATRKDFEIGNLTGNLTLANFSNKKAGDRGVIRLKQDGTGSRTLGVGSHFVLLGAGTLATAASAVTILSYVVWDSSTVYYTLTKV